MISILDALRDRLLFGASPAFGDLSTWKPWITFLGATYGLPLDADGEDLFRRCTGRTSYDPPPGGWTEVVCIVGRQAGKTRISALLVAFEAALAEAVKDGEVYALLLAQDWRAAIRASFSYIRSMLDASPILRRSVTRETTDTIDLENGLRIATYPCRPSSVRGLRARIVLLDELAFFRSGDGIATDTEMLRSVRPALATTGGKLVVISSPYAQAGALYDLHRRHFARDGSPVLVWQADAALMNPTLPADYLERMREEDPEAYRSEVLGEFRTGLSMLLDPEVLERAVVPGRLELPPLPGVHYRAFVDPSGGRSDAFTLAVAHQEKQDAPAVVDAIRAWKPPLNPSGVVAECADLLRAYGVQRVVGDRYAGEWPREQFRAHGIAYDLAEKPKSDLYLDFVAHVNGSRVELPEQKELLRELRLLERKRGASGKDRVDHPPGGHDDLANAVAGVVALFLSRQQEATWGLLYPPRDGQSEDDGIEVEIPRRRGLSRGVFAG